MELLYLYIRGLKMDWKWFNLTNNYSYVFGADNDDDIHYNLYKFTSYKKWWGGKGEKRRLVKSGLVFRKTFVNDDFNFEKIIVDLHELMRDIAKQDFKERCGLRDALKNENLFKMAQVKFK